MPHTQPDWASLELAMGRQTAAEKMVDATHAKDHSDKHFISIFPIPELPDAALRLSHTTRARADDPRRTIRALMRGHTHLYPVVSSAERHRDLGSFYYRLPTPQDADFTSDVPDYHQSICAFQEGANFYDARPAVLEHLYDGSTHPRHVRAAANHLLESLAGMSLARYCDFFRMMKECIEVGHYPDMDGRNLLVHLATSDAKVDGMKLIDPGALWSPGEERYFSTYSLTPARIKSETFCRFLLGERSDSTPHDTALKGMTSRQRKAYRVFCQKVDHAAAVTGYPVTEEALLALHGTRTAGNYHPATIAEATRPEYPLVPLHQTGSGLFLLKELDRRMIQDAEYGVRK